MKNIELDDDIYSYLLSRACEIGESASSILRRELRLAGSSLDGQPTESGHELSALIQSPRMKFGNSTDRFLTILSEAHKIRPKEFERVLEFKGRDRIYFAKSQQEIARSGRSTHPAQVPNSDFWVMTNSPTHQKKLMVRQVLETLGISSAAIQDAVRAI